jgi:apolipoprotein N-acyltransferase
MNVNGDCVTNYLNISIQHPVYMVLRKAWIYWPSLLMSAVMVPFAFAPYYQYWLAPLFLAELLIYQAIRPEWQVRSAYFWALTAYTSLLYWIDIALHDIAALPQYLAWPLTLLLPAYLAFYPAAVFWLLGRFRLSPIIRNTVLFPLLWTLAEFVRERALTGFGWGAIGYTQIADSPLAGFAPVGGIFLVTLVTVTTGAWLAMLLLVKRRLKKIGYGIGLVGIWVLGALLLRHNFTQPDGTQATIALGQGNIAQSLKWNVNSLQPTLQRYLDQIASTRANIVILPETAIPVMRQDMPSGQLELFTQMAKHQGSALAVGIPQYTDDGKGYLNAVVNLTSSSESTEPSYYAKNHLVPFGEYIPIPSLMGWIYQLMDMPLAGFSVGGSAQKPLQMANQRVAFNICYEDGFGDELIAAARQASLLANISNMAWYGHSHAMQQHLQQSQARALETGRYMVRATNTGMTAIINPKGKIVAQLDPDIAAVLEGNIQGYQGNTPYMYIGSSWPMAIICLLLVSIFWLYGRFRVRSL